jgi:uncharacterized protein YecT (DUF1311 family)
MTEGWKPTDRAALAALRRAADGFFQAHARKEADLEATFEVQEVAFLEDRFIEALQRFEQGELPRFSATDFREADAAMSAAFAGTQQDGTRRWGTATPAGIKDAQRAWVGYRDAWVQFGRTRYPAVSPDSWKTWLTEERTGMLERFR